MILIADSGSSKTDWILLNIEGGIENNFLTLGYNPMIVDSDFIINDLNKYDDLIALRTKVSHVYFFGAGCINAQHNLIVHNALIDVFTKSNIFIDHDLTASAYAAYAGKPVICAILGTGSNSCFFDGKELFQDKPALGFILGDEGSGSYFGKILLKQYLYGSLSDDLSADFNNTFGLDKSQIFQCIYKSKRPNTFLASFMPFYAKHKNHSQIKQWLIEGFDEFVKMHVLDFPINEISFVGSIGHYFQDELETVCKQNGIQMMQNIKHPIDNLAKYVYDYLLNSLDK